jgi:NADH:ubiquinone oxidoreductase subunit 2 (subunit N)
MAYYLRVIKTFLGHPEEGFKVHEAAPIMVTVTIIMAFLIIVFGVWPGPVVKFAEQASQALVNGINAYIGAVLK